MTDILLKGGQTTKDPRLDRVPSFDEASLNYLIRDIPKLMSAQAPVSKGWNCPVHLDQGKEGACVGFSRTQAAAAEPKNVPDLTDAVAQEVYKSAQLIDEWPGEAYSGSSVLAGAKIGVERGWHTSYHWAKTLDEIVMGLSFVGPVVFGMDWYSDMYDPKRGLLVPSGEKVGGHAIMANAVSIKHRHIRFHNSWGPSWGLNGAAWMSFANVERVLLSGGECCLSVV